MLLWKFSEVMISGNILKSISLFMNWHILDEICFVTWLMVHLVYLFLDLGLDDERNHDTIIFWLRYLNMATMYNNNWNIIFWNFSQEYGVIVSLFAMENKEMYCKNFYSIGSKIWHIKIAKISPLCTTVKKIIFNAYL